MNRLQAKVIWDLIMYYFIHEAALYKDYPTRKSYVQAHTRITDDDFQKYWNLYLHWVPYDMEHQGEIKVYDYIYNNWNKN